MDGADEASWAEEDVAMMTRPACAIVIAGSFVAGDALADKQADTKRALKPHPVVVCERNDNITLEGVVIEASKEVAVTSGASCKLTIRNSKIVSTGNFAISLGGSSKVTLDSVEIDGKWASVTSGGSANVTIVSSTLRGPFSVGGSATVKLANSTLHGARSVTSGATFVDGGGNKFHTK
jgi:hypothetical protein